MFSEDFETDFGLKQNGGVTRGYERVLGMGVVLLWICSKTIGF